MNQADYDKVVAKRQELINIYIENMLIGGECIYNGFYYDVILDDIIVTGIQSDNVVKYNKLVIPPEFTGLSSNENFRQQLESLPIKRIDLGLVNRCTDIINLEGLEEVTGEAVLSVANAAFANNHTLKKVDFPNLEQLAPRAFYLCTALESVELNHLQIMGNEGFAGCSSLRSVKMENLSFLNVDSSGAFMGCTALKTVDLSKAVWIQTKLFEGCNSIENLNLPNVQLIDTLAFNGCLNLKTVRFAYLRHIAENAFLNCANLSIVNYDGTEDNFAQIEIVGDNELNLFKKAKIVYNYKPAQKQ